MTEQNAIPPPPLKAAVYVTAFIAALAGLLFGLDIGVISGALPFIAKQYALTSAVSEWIVSSILAGAVLGTFASAPVSRRWGRKTALLLSAVIFVLGSLGSALAPSPAALIGVRFFLGLAVGIASFTAPLYLAEMAPQRIRGALISMYQLMITIGIVLAFLSDTALSYGCHWRWMLGVLAFPATGMFLGMLALPQSPRWLFLVGRKAEGRGVLSKLRGSEAEVEAEAAEIETALLRPGGGFALLANRNFRRVLLLGFALQVAQQFTGINIMMYYAPKIFSVAGFAATEHQMFGTVLIGAVNVLATFIAIAFVDKFGRKPILALGFVVMALSLLAVGAALWMIPAAATSPGLWQFLAVGFLILFIVGFAMSAGPIIWVLCSEIYPLAGRDLGITVSTATNWFANMLIGATFLTALETLGNAQTFWLFGALNVTFIFLVVFLCPETKGVSLERIEERLMAGLPLRRIGR